MYSNGSKSWGTGIFLMFSPAEHDNLMFAEWKLAGWNEYISRKVKFKFKKDKWRFISQIGACFSLLLTLLLSGDDIIFNVLQFILFPTKIKWTLIFCWKYILWFYNLMTTEECVSYMSFCQNDEVFSICDKLFNKTTTVSLWSMSVGQKSTFFKVCYYYMHSCVDHLYTSLDSSWALFILFFFLLHFVFL